MRDEQLLRYSRQIMLADLDIAGQEKLLASTVLIVGAGGLGCPAALYLAAAGVGRLLLCDDDQVELSNLQRQIAHDTARIGMDKVESLANAIRELNPEVMLETHALWADEKTLVPLLEKADLVLDCTDNFTTRFLLNRLCFEYKKPLVSGAAIRMEGQLAVFDLRDSDSPCYRCLYSEEHTDAASCAESGVLAAVVGVIGSWQALEAIKMLAGFTDTMNGKLLAMDFKSAEIRRLNIRKDANCPVCTQKHKAP